MQHNFIKWRFSELKSFPTARCISLVANRTVKTRCKSPQDMRCARAERSATLNSWLRPQHEHKPHVTFLTCMLEISTMDVMSCWCICTTDSVYVTVWNDISLWINLWIMDGAIQPGQDWLFRSAGKVLSGPIWFWSSEAQYSVMDWVEKYNQCYSWSAYTCSPLAKSSLVDDVILFWLQLKAPPCLIVHYTSQVALVGRC